MNLQSPDGDVPFEFLPYARFVLKRRRLVIGLVLGAFLSSIVVSLVLPKKYLAIASILPPQEESPGLALPSQVSVTRALFGLRNPSEIWLGVLRSRTVAQALVERFHLMDRFESETPEGARRVLASMTDISASREKIISVAVESTDPELAAQLANAYVEEADRLNRNRVMTAGRRMRTFTEERLEQARAELSRAEDQLRQFQSNSSAIKLDIQSEAIIKTVGTVKGTLMAKEMEYQTLLSYATPTHPRVETLQAELRGLRRQLQELEQGQSGAQPRDRSLIPTAQLPELGLEAGRLIRSVKIQETLHELLVQQYEMARIQEAKDTPTMDVLDFAIPPTEKSKPRRTLIVIITTLAAAVLAPMLAVALELRAPTRAHASGT